MFPGKEHRIRAITVPEFKRWVVKHQFDTDRDGRTRISRKELREAFRRRARFSDLRTLSAVPRADRSRNGFLDDDSEIEGLIEFVERELGFMITMDDDARVPPRPSSARPSNAVTAMSGQSRSPTYKKNNDDTCSSDRVICCMHTVALMRHVFRASEAAAASGAI